MTDQPTLPYGGSSGHAGSQTSRERAAQRDTSGRTHHLQERVLGLVERWGTRGLTIKELRERYPSEHHGSLSAALSNLHKGGRIVRLAEVRDRCKVYVALGYTEDRAVEPPGRVARPGLGPVADEMARLLRRMLTDPTGRAVAPFEIDRVLAEYDRIVHR